jgi:hypothetical protein
MKISSFNTDFLPVILKNDIIILKTEMNLI